MKLYEQFIYDMLNSCNNYGLQPIIYRLRAMLNAYNSSAPLTASATVSQTATSTCIIPDDTGTLKTIGTGIPVIPWSRVTFDTALGATAGSELAGAWTNATNGFNSITPSGTGFVGVESTGNVGAAKAVSIAIEPGETYAYSLVVASTTTSGSTFVFGIGNDASGLPTWQHKESPVTIPNSASPQTITGFFTTTATDNAAYPTVQLANTYTGTIELTSFSLKKITPAYLPTASGGSALATATTLQSGLTRYSSGPAGNPSLGVLCEPSYTNAFTYSEQFDHADWTKTAMLAFGSGSTANATTAPAGNVTADLLTPTTANTYHGIQQNKTTTTATLSVFVKPNGYNFIALRQRQGTGEVVTVVFDTTLGTVTQTTNQGTTFTSVTSSIKAYANSFYRISLTATRSSGTTNCAIDFCNSGTPTLDTNGVIAFAANGTSGAYFWGAQVEASSVPTSYILSTTATTRAARYLTMTGSDIGSKLRFNLVSNETLSTAGRTTRLFSDGTRMLGYSSFGGVLNFADTSQTVGGAVYSTDFSSSTGWGFTSPGGANVAQISGGVLSLTSDGTLVGAYRTISCTLGKWYKITLDATVVSGSAYLAWTGGTVADATISSSGAKTFYIVCSSEAASSFNITRLTACNITIDNLVVTEVAQVQWAINMTAGTAYQIGVDMGTSAALYVNGSSVNTATFPAAAQFSGTTYIGSSTTGTNVLNGYITCIESSSDPNFSAGGTT